MRSACRGASSRNVVDHADTRCAVDVSESDEGLLIEVRDDPSPWLILRGLWLQLV